MAAMAVTQVVVTVTGQVTLGMAGVSHGLVLGALTGSATTGLVYLAVRLRRNRLWHIGREMRPSQLYATVLEHKSFPLYTLPADAINVVVQQFVPVFLTATFGPVAAGLYAFATRVVRVPLFVVSGAVATVLRHRAIESVRSRSLPSLYRKTVLWLSLVALPPFAVLWLFSPPLFALAFGDRWSEAGRIVHILSPGMLLEFVAFPMAALFLVTRTQWHMFRLQLLSAVLLAVAIAAGRFRFESFTATCVMVSGAMVITNVLTLLVASRVAKHSGLRSTHTAAGGGALHGLKVDL